LRVLTEIDAKATLKKSTDADAADFFILGAWSPKMAHEPMKAEPSFGAIDLAASMSAFDNA
jgi:uncharacterized protein (DUF302 family)